jgi:hypothetical protein
MRISRELTVGLFQRCNQFNNFCACWIFCGRSELTSVGGDRPFSRRSKRFATAVLRSFVRGDYCKKPLRCGFGVVGVGVVGINRDRFIKLQDVVA